MDNITNITDAPLTRRQAREIERRTGVRPVASSSAFRHDTGEIVRNEMTALVSVLPTELVERIAESVAPREEIEIPAAFDGRSLTVRAAVPASIVAQRRRRTAGSFAAAAAVTAVASVGLASAGAGGDVVAADHQANLLTATAPAEAADEVVDAAAETDTIAPAAPAVVTEGETTVAAFDSAAIASVATAAVATPSTSTSTSSSSSSDSTPAAGSSTSSFVPTAGSLQENILAAAYAQIGISGLDCTDMVQDALAAVGLVTSRFDGGPDLGVSSFFAFGTEISWDQAMPGDIIIAPGEHVAIYARDGMSVHGGWNGAADDTVLAGLGPYSYYVVRVG